MIWDLREVGRDALEIGFEPARDHKVMRHAGRDEFHALEVADLDRPVKGKSEDAVDAWVGYEWKFYKNLNWRIQFNVRNVFGKDKLLPNSVEPNGEVATYRISEPRTFTLTNTLKF